MKRFRRAVQPRLIRFYLVGEYGDKTLRPHYHIALFGAPLSDHIQIEKTWKHGHVHIGDLTPQSAAYLCGYVTKKIVSLEGRLAKTIHPEFARMSNRPGIGAKAMELIGETIFTNKHALQQVMDTHDVPHTLKHGGKEYPLGQYLRQQIRNYIGMPDTFRQQNTYHYSLELSARLQAAISDPNNDQETISQILVHEKQQAVLSQAARLKIFSKERKL